MDKETAISRLTEVIAQRVSIIDKGSIAFELPKENEIVLRDRYEDDNGYTNIEEFTFKGLIKIAYFEQQVKKQTIKDTVSILEKFLDEWN